MKIPAPNYTQSPNVLYDNIFKTLTEGELRVILVIIRQTFGWHKSFDKISLSQLAEKTGMERKSVCRSLNSLISKKLIEKKKFGTKGKERIYYSLIIEHIEPENVKDDDGIESEEEMKLVSKSLYQCPKDTPPVSERHQTSVLKTPTKETKTKETISKEKQQQPLSPLPKEKPTPAYVSSSFSFLEKELKGHVLEMQDRYYLTEKFSFERIKLAWEFVRDDPNPIKKSLIKMLVWHCKQKIPPVHKPDSNPQQTAAQAYAEKLIQHKECYESHENFALIPQGEKCYVYLHGGFTTVSLKNHLTELQKDFKTSLEEIANENYQRRKKK